MKTNKLPHWLQGGLIAVAVLLVPLFYTIIFSVEDGSAIDWFMLSLLAPYAFAAFWFGGVMNLITGILAQALIYFIVGSLIGFIYSTFKK